MADNPTRTILGFHTRNRASALGMDFTFYGFIIPMEWIFAFFGLAIILSDFHWAMKAIVASAIVGIAVFTKIALYGRKRFGAAALAICLFATSMTVFFDFIGLSMHTSVRSMLGEEVATAEAIVTDYNTVMLRLAAEAESALEAERLQRTGEVEAWKSRELLMLERRRAGADVSLLREQRGVREEGFTGVVGDRGPGTRERQADVDSLAITSQVEVENVEAEATRQVTAINQEIAGKVASITTLRATLAKLVIPPVSAEDAGELDFSAEVAVVDGAIIDRILEARSFEQLMPPVRDANNRMSEASAMYKAATGKSKDPKKITVEGGNLFDLSLRALFSGDIAAIVSLLLALGFGWLDPFIAYFTRRSERDDDFDDKDGGRPFDPEAALTDELPASGRRRGPQSVS